MNSTIREITNRKSVRVFEEKDIPYDIKEQILNAAFMAPTAGNQMLYAIIDVTDKTLKEKLAITCDHQPFIAKAPLVLIFLADCRRWFDAYHYAGQSARKPGLGDLFLAFQDAIIAAQNTVVAAESFGIGSCYIGDILENAETHIELFGLDEFVVPISMVVFGYPTIQQNQREKPKRFEKKYIVHENRFRRLDEAEHRDMFLERANDADFEFDSYIEKFCKRKYMSDFSMEMTRSAEYYARKFLKQEDQ